ncbi:unnamed protein product, partial [Polarella glacialis]
CAELPASQAVLQELERCRMRLEDNWSAGATCAVKAAETPTKTTLSRCRSLPPVPQYVAPRPEELPLLAELRLRRSFTTGVVHKPQACGQALLTPTTSQRLRPFSVD